MEQRFELFAANTGVTTTLYYRNGQLYGVMFEPNASDVDTLILWFDYACRRWYDLERLQEEVRTIGATRNWTLVEIFERVDFDTFWEKYKYKVDRLRAEQVWNSLNERQRSHALSNLRDYEKELRQTGAAKMYPKTYLQIFKKQK